MTMFTKRIVVTGLGAVTPVGNDPSTFWQALLDGTSGVQSIGSLAARGARPSYTAEVKDLAPEAAGLPRKRLKMMGRQAQLAYVAVAHASADAESNRAAASTETSLQVAQPETNRMEA